MDTSEDIVPTSNNVNYSGHYLKNRKPSAIENQDDSGHPSIDASSDSNGSIKEEDSSTPTSLQRNKRQNIFARKLTNSSVTGTTGTSNERPNPFLVGTKRGPNKIILQPIEIPLRNGLNHMALSLNHKLTHEEHQPDVPKHLFIAKPKLPLENQTG